MILAASGLGPLKAPASGGEIFENQVSQNQVGAPPESDFVLTIILLAGVWGRYRPQPPEAKFLKIKLLGINFGALPQSDLFLLSTILGAGVWGRYRRNFWGRRRNFWK